LNPSTLPTNATVVGLCW